MTCLTVSIREQTEEIFELYVGGEKGQQELTFAKYNHVLGTSLSITHGLTKILITIL